MRKLLCLCFVLLVSNLYAINLSALMMHSVFKISGIGKDNKPVIGTCFFISKRINNGLYQPVLITAAHILKKLKGKSASIDFRFKTNSGFVSVTREIQIKSGSQIVWRELGDIAAIKLELPLKSDVKSLSTDFLATDKLIKKYSINSGTSVAIIGYPYGTGFGKAQFPILRNGCISSFPINSKNDFLVDFDIFEGYSGAPVVVNQNGIDIILGMVVEEVFLEEIKPGSKTSKIKGLGLGKVLPAALIKQLVDAI